MNKHNFPINIIFDSRNIIQIFNQVSYFSPIFINQISLFFKKANDRIQKGLFHSAYMKGCFCDPFRLQCQTVLLLGGVAVIWTHSLPSLSLLLLSIHNDRKLPTRQWVGAFWGCTWIQDESRVPMSNSLNNRDIQAMLRLFCNVSHMIVQIYVLLLNIVKYSIIQRLANLC